MADNWNLIGTVNIDGTGNAQNNIISGDDGNKILPGWVGDDSLMGGVAH